MGMVMTYECMLNCENGDFSVIYASFIEEPNLWLLFNEEDEIVQGYCECTTEKCLKTIENHLKYIEDNTVGKSFDSETLKSINKIKDFLIEKKYHINCINNGVISFDFSEDSDFDTLNNSFNLDILKGKKISTNKKRLTNLFNDSNI